jgi:chromate transporter
MGFTAFGGPAAHVAIMEEEVVERRQWVSKETFLDMYGATNVIPGPNSTELVLHLGFLRAGVFGMIVAGLSFITPPMIMVLALAHVYVAYGTLPEVTTALAGIQPVIVAVVFVALIKLWKKAIKNPPSYGLVAGVFLLALLGVHELLIMLGSGLLMLLYVNRSKLRAHLSVSAPLVLLAAEPARLETIFWNFLKIGSILYGGGYVLLVFIESDFVHRLDLITDAQLLDAVAVGQLTPGPLFTTAAFIGYLLRGIPGGLLATLGIFLPSFLLVGLLHKILPYLRTNTWLSGFLDGVVVASLGLMAYVLVTLAEAAFLNLWTIALGLVAFVLLFQYRVSSAFLVVGGGLLGYLVGLF